MTYRVYIEETWIVEADSEEEVYDIVANGDLELVGHFKNEQITIE